MPHRRACAWHSGVTSAVSPTTVRPGCSSRRAEVVSQPSMSGMWMSMNVMSGRSAGAAPPMNATASGPLSKKVPWQSQRVIMAFISSRFSLVSSTTMTLRPVGHACGRRGYLSERGGEGGKGLRMNYFSRIELCG